MILWVVLVQLCEVHAHPRDAEGALFWIELDPVAIKVVERLAEIVDKCSCLLGFDDYVVDIDLNVATDLVLEAGLHASLVRGTRVL